MNVKHVEGPEPTMDEHDPFAGPAIESTVATSEPQREIWMATQVGEDASLAYNESVTLWMRGPLDLACLRESLRELVMRHEALRATFSADGLTMIVAATSEIEPLVVNAEGSAVAHEEQWQSLLEQAVTEPFDLTGGPLLRVTVFAADAQEHRVIVTAHHIVCDGWSTAVIVRDWAELYSAGAEGRLPSLPPASRFADYAREETQTAQGPVGKANEAFWISRFADGVPTLELPFDHQRPAVRQYASLREDLVIDEATVRDLRRVSSAERASLFATFLAVFEVLLSRLSGQGDLVVGVPAAGQAVTGQEALVGHCVNLLPLRARVNPEQTFRELLAEVRTSMLDAYDHQQYTFGSLLKRLPIARDPSRLPLVSVVFNLDRGLKDDALQFHGIQTHLTTNPRRFENFDLFVNAVELDGKVTLECQYNTDLLDRGTVSRWLGAYVRLIRSICANPSERVGWLSVLTDEDTALLSRWNDEATRAWPESGHVHDLFRQRVSRAPSAVAVEFERAHLTYQDLDARSDAVAQRLHGAGVGPGSLVGLCAERSPDMVIGVLGILKAGAAYVPLDPGYPVDRLVFMVQDSQMTALVTQRALREELPLHVANVILLEDIAPITEAAPRYAVGPDDPAYVIYTSGSTGRPKGVLVPHRALSNLVASVTELPGLTEHDVVLAVTTLSFDISVSEILLPLTVGAKIVVASREVASDGHRLLALLKESKATFLDATPATWRLLIAAGWKGGEGLKAICTGEKLPRELARELLERCASLWNGYGPTETTVWSTFWRVVDPVDRILIGKPVANTQVYVLDTRMQPMPIGAVGELFIGGASVTLGYHRRPELTQERFLPDPNRGGDARMYKTGDLVRFLPDGNLECLGRNDSQVKLRGYRIELGEIESVIARHPDVSQTTVIVREDRPGDARLVAYVALRPSAMVGEADLRDHAKTALPEYMVPQHFVTLASFPLLPNGKVDRRNLPPPSQTRADSHFVEPQTPTERIVADLWQHVLGIGRVGANEDFFALGGHSLLASQVIARLRRDQGIEVTFRKMFEAPTVAKLAAAIDAGAGSKGTDRVLSRRTDRSAGVSVPQRRLWLLEEMDPAQRLVHNLCASWRLDGPLDVPSLQRAIDEIVRRHETLRSNFRSEGGEPVPFIHADRKISILFVDLSTLPEGDREAALSKERDAQAAVPFNLSEDPLLRVTLFKLADDRHVLSTLQHNIVWDGWSFDVFLGELTEFYGAFVKGGAPRKEPLAIAYSDFAAWQRDWLGTPAFEEQAAFWRKQLAGASLPLEIPTDQPRKGTRSRAGGSQGIHVSGERTAALLSLARDHGATLFMLLFAAYSALLHRYTGQRQFLIGVPSRARTRSEAEGLIGIFVNTIALRATVEPSMTFVDLLASVRELTLDAFDRQDVPLDALGVRAPMLRALFSLQDARSRPAKLGEAEVAQEHIVAPVAASELMLWAMESRSDLLLMANYASDLFEGETILRFLQQLDALLEQVQANPLQRVGSIPILPPAHLAAIEAAGGRVHAGREEDVFTMVSRVAAEHPDALAVDAGDRSLSYSALVARTNAVADGLFAKGVAPGSRVAIRVADGVDRIVATLAVMALGATCVLGDGESASLTLEALPETGAPLTPRVPKGAPDSVACVDRGVAVLQAALVRALSGVAQVAELRPSDAVGVDDARLRDMPALFATLLPLAVGARICLPRGRTDAPFASAGVTVALLAPAVSVSLAGSGVRTALVLGTTSPTHRGKLLAEIDELFELPFSTGHALPVGVHRIRRGQESEILARPLPSTAWSVVDAEGASAPMNVVGTLRVDLGQGPLATGDRARLLANGAFELLGRTDGRIPLDDGLVDAAEIGRVLEKNPAVAEAWVSVREDAGGERRLVAYYVPKPGTICTETELRGSVRAALGDRAVPRMLVELDVLPRDVAGAVDDERLESPYAISSVHDYVAPRSDAENYLVALWKETLGVARVGVYDNFFDLGGHSLLCFRIVSRIERETGKRVSPRIVLLGTLEQIAVEIGIAEPQAGQKDVADAATRNANANVDAGQATKAGRMAKWIKGFVKR